VKAVEVENEVVLDDSIWERISEATNGAADPCFQCGVCTAICPWGLLKDEPLPVRQLMRRAQLGIAEQNGEMWWCTTCRACEAACPRAVPIADVMLALRKLAWRDNVVPEGVSSVMWALHWDGNPWRRPPSQRENWSRGTEIKAFESTDEILYYIGCTPSYDNRTQKVARALTGVFAAAGVSFGTLGEREPCCGDAAYGLGQHDYLEKIIEENVRLFSEAGVGNIVTVSPHCYDMFLNHYPQQNGFRPLHYTQYLAQLIDEKRLDFQHRIEAKVAFHDPCYLGRRNDIYDAPRQVLAAIPGVEVVELPHSGDNAICCGGGGGRMWMETEAGERFGDLRVQEATQVSADILVTACPHCIACLEDSLNPAESSMRVMDVGEMAAAALGLDGGTK
jgi:Fe-S oxidoreductase